MYSDPHVLVPLRTRSIGHQLRAVTVNRGVPAVLPFPPRTGDDTNICILPVLDAISGMFVADGSGHVVAVALQVAFRQPQVVLMVAENGPVIPDVSALVWHDHELI